MERLIMNKIAENNSVLINKNGLPVEDSPLFDCASVLFFWTSIIYSSSN